MHLDTPKNANYCATVVRVNHLVRLENSDRLQAIPLFGLQAIVDLGTQLGDLGVMFPAEVQLSAEYVHNNSMYRHSELNLDITKKGYFEDNRRVRAIKLRGHRSDALFMPLSSLEFTGVDISQLKEDDTFDTLNGIEVCRKYVRPGYERAPRGSTQPALARVDKRFLPEHFDSSYYLRVEGGLDKRAHAVVTQKLHGTSIRIGHTIVNRKLTWLERLAKRLGVHVRETEFDMVFGSRKVIKGISSNHNHFYGEDLWGREGAKLTGLIPENYIVYGELIGWVSPAEPIQKHYTYAHPPGTCSLWVYRIAIVNSQGAIADLGWDALKEWCTQLGLNHVPEIWRGTLHDMDAMVDEWMLDRAYHAEGYHQAVPLSADSPCDEGVCVRIEGLIPQIYKIKAPTFLQHETRMLDENVVDTEEQGATP